MKRILFLLLIMTGTGGLLSAGDWVPSYRIAKTQALCQNKKILIFFSGSDWCAAGRILDRDLFRTAAFKRLASRKYVLYNADFPKYSKLGQETEERNRRLAARYGVHRFPAVIVIEPKHGGLLVRQIGMKDMTPKKLLEKLSAIETETARSYRLPEKNEGGRSAP